MTIGVNYFSFLPGGEGIEYLHFFRKTAGNFTAQHGRQVGAGHQQKIVAARMPDEIVQCAVFFHGFGDDGSQKTEHVIQRDNPLNFFKGIHIFDADIQQCPVFPAFDAFQVFFDEFSAGQTGGRVGEIFVCGAPNCALHPQFQFLDVERFGDIIIRAEFKPFNFVAAFIFLG